MKSFRYTIYGCMLFIAAILMTSNATAQDEKKNRNSSKRDSVKAAKIAEGKGILSFLGGPGYTPELKLLLAVGGLYSFKTNPKDSLIQRSTVNGSFGVTIPDAGIVSKLILTSFWKQDKMRIYANLWLKDIPDHYYGVGIEDAQNTPKSDSTTAYLRFWWQINPKFLFRLKKNLYLGPMVDFNFTKIKEPSQGVQDDPTYQQYGDKNFNAGGGVVLQYDSRDIPVNAYRGVLLQIQGGVYGGYLGGDNNYYLLDIDFRNYLQLAKVDGQTLAWTIRGRFTTQDVPYAEMSQLGTPNDLRGYTWGRYRDESMLYGIAEYRHMFMRRSGQERSKHGFVAWVGAGTVMQDISQISTFLPNFGIGYRFEVQPRMNVRFDYGWGNDTSGLYFNFTEAF
jgi:Omp85 superfamily domain